MEPGLKSPEWSSMAGGQWQRLRAGPLELRRERAQSAGRSRDRSIVPDAVGSAES